MGRLITSDISGDLKETQGCVCLESTTTTSTLNTHSLHPPASPSDLTAIAHPDQHGPRCRSSSHYIRRRSCVTTASPPRRAAPHIHYAQAHIARAHVRTRSIEKKTVPPCPEQPY